MRAVLVAGGRAVGLDSSLVKARDVVAVRSAADLLIEAEATLARAREDAADLRTAAEAAGRRTALNEADAVVQDTVVTLTSQLTDGLAARRADIAAAALAATRTILGTFDEAELVGRLAEGALSRVLDDEQVVVRVAAEHARVLAERLAARTAVTVVGDAASGRFDCAIATADGTIVADLPVQLASLAERWGVAR